MRALNNRRVLIIDDNESIHVDFRKIIGRDATRETVLDSAAAALFDEPSERQEQVRFELDSAHQGQEGLACVQQSVEQGRQYAMAFVDVRMPPGWDGIETIRRLWQVDADLQVVICTAYSDHSWAEMVRVLGETDRLLILKKPFDIIEVRQITAALVAKWNLAQAATRSMQDLQEMVRERTSELDASNQELRHEIVEHQRTEESLREAEARTHAILDTAPDGIVTIDEAGGIESLNGVAQSMFGYSVNELIGKNITIVMPSFNDRHKDAAIGEQVIGPIVASQHHPMTGRHRNGQDLFVEVGWSEWKFQERTLCTAIVRDMTEQRKLEAQLIQAQTLESIGHLAAGIAHEINTPIQYIGDNAQFLEEAFQDLTPLFDQIDGLLQMARHDNIDPERLLRFEAAMKQADMTFLRSEIPKAIDRSLEGIERVATIVKSIREFSHPDGGVKTDVDLNRAIESASIMARNEWKTIAELLLDFDPKLPLVPCFAAEVNQVLLNLIVNAAHAIDEAQAARSSRELGQITLRTSHDQGWAEVQVSDTGGGIAPENYDRIFDPFFTTKQRGKGTGQGLSIARSIIEQKHHGQLTFTSQLGKGTTFTIRLPLDPGH